MRESIYAIPIHDVFGEKCGCPVCRLWEMLEKRCTEYIMGAAMFLQSRNSYAWLSRKCCCEKVLTLRDYNVRNGDHFNHVISEGERT